jgi:hypothetical protein
LERSKDDDDIIDENIEKAELVKKPKSSKRKTALLDIETSVPTSKKVLNKKQRPEARMERDVNLKVRRKSYINVICRLYYFLEGKSRKWCRQSPQSVFE